ncbi:MAG TPA: hypothetical protein VNK05_02395 [Chloroflexota bacterium]|nr:hypothetical protein [Chloroflexota bacterium]
MPGLLAQLPDPAQMQAVRDGVSQQSQTLASITTTLGTMPIGDIRALAEALSGLSLPDLTPLGDALPSNLGDLTGRLPADPAALLGQLPQLLSRLAAGAEGDLLGALGPALEQFTVFQELSGRLAAIQEAVTRLGPLVQAVSDPGSLASKSPAELVQFASDLLQLAQPFGVLGGDSQTWLLGLVETLRLWSTGTPEQLSGFVTGRIAALEADVRAAAGGIPAAVAALGALTAVVSGVDPATLLGPALADLESLPALDFASAAGLQTARTTLGRVQTTLGGATATLGEQIDQAISRLQQSGVGALEDELQRLVLTLRAVADLETTDNPLAQTARQVSGWIAGLDSPDVQAAVQGVLAELRDVARRFDLSALQAPLVQAAGQILQGVEEVERLQAEVAAGITALFDQVREAIEQVDLAAVQQRVQEALQAFRDQTTPVRAQIQGLVDALRRFLTDLQNLPELNVQSVIDQLGDLLTRLNGALTDPGVAGAIDAVRQTLDEIAHALDGVSFDPLIQEVVADIRETAARLREIDPQSLNELLRAALKAAVAVLEATDFERDVTDALVGELDDVEQGALRSAEQAARRLDELTAGVRELDPEQLIAGPLESAVDAAKRQVASVRPGAALQPALGELDALLVRLEDLAPSRLLRPALDFRDRLIATVGGLSGADLLRPLDDALRSLREALARLDPDTWFAPLEQYSAALGSAWQGLPVLDLLPQLAAFDLQDLQLITGLDPDRVAQAIRAKLGAALGVFDAVDVGPARGATAALQDALDGVSPRGLRDGVQRTLDAAQAAAAIDLAGPLAALGAAWARARTATGAATPPDALRGDYDEVVALLEAANPTTVLAPSVAALEDLRTELTLTGESALGAIDRAAATADDLVTRLRALYPRDLSLAHLQASLLASLDDVLVAPAVAVAGTLRTYGGAVSALLNVIQEIITGLTRAIGFIADPVSVLQPVRDALRTLHQKVSTFGLDALEEQVDRTAGAVRDRLAAFDLAALLAELDATFAGFVREMRDLLSQTLVGDLDDAFRSRVDGVVQQLDVGALLEPLRPTLQQIEDTLALLSVEALFAPLAAVLERLLDELKAGLRQTGSEFGQMVRAVPV